MSRATSFFFPREVSASISNESVQYLIAKSGGTAKGTSHGQNEAPSHDVTDPCAIGMRDAYTTGRKAVSARSLYIAANAGMIWAPIDREGESLNIKYCSSRYLDSVACAERLSDDAFISQLFMDCTGKGPTPDAARLRSIMLKTGFPRSRMRHDMLTTAQFRRRLSNAPFWIFYDLFVRIPLHPFQQVFLKKVKNLGVEGKLILEVGCTYGDTCKALACEPVKRIIGIDLVLTRDFYFDQLDIPCEKDSFHEAEVIRDKYELREMDIRKTNFKTATFDLAISSATLEHIRDLDQALLEIHRILKPGGLFFSRWEQIWSAADGHHFFHWFKDLPVFGDRLYEPLQIPPWGHLLMSEQELFDYIRNLKGEEVATFACERIYHAEYLNRLLPEEYLSIIKRSPFEILKLERIPGPVPSPEILKALPRFTSEDLHTAGFEMLLRK